MFTAGPRYNRITKSAMSKYFHPSEFKRCTPSCCIDDMNAAFLDILDRVRERAGIPLVLNSAYRSKAYEHARGRSGNGAHTRGMAVDIRCNTSANRMKIVRAALECGIVRIGIGKTYVHLDCDTSLVQGVIWHYYD